MKLWTVGMLAGALCSASGFAMADCTPTNGGVAFVGSTPLQAANLTVGREVPLGAVIYRQQVKSSKPIGWVSCEPSPATIGYRGEVSVTPLPLSSWSTGMYAGKVYETGVPGIGVALLQINDLGTEFVAPWINTSSRTCPSGCTLQLIVGFLDNIEMRLIKIGPTASGTILGEKLPTTQVGYGTGPVGDNRVFQASFAGSINIVSRTCQTPDINVDMGERKVSEFSGINTGTPWQDFNIVLNDCPAFYGGFPLSGPQLGSDGSIISAGTREANVIRYRVDPNQTPISASRGVMKLDAAADDSPAAATGVGLQIADKNGTPLALATLKASGIVPTANDGASYTIPLRARYLQTESKVTGGPANATAVFTINYQ